MKRITSPDNPALRLVKGLQQKKIREREESYLIEGFHLIQEAIHAVRRPASENHREPGEGLRFVLIRESLFIEDEREKGTTNLAESLEAGGIPVYTVANDIFDRVSDTETPQGILAAVRRKTWTSGEFFEGSGNRKNGNVIVLDRLQDPGNVGTILRTAEAADYLGALILKGTVDVYGPKVVRAASGALFRLPVLFVEDPFTAAGLLHSHGKRIISATPYCDQYYYESDLSQNAAIVIGNEGGGIDPVLLAESDQKIRIPMNPEVDSLNAAVAAGLLMYEAMRK